MDESAKPAIKLGILGCAGIAKKVSRAALLAGPGVVQLYAIGSRSLQKARDFAKENSFPDTAKIYDSYQAVLDDERVDAVYIPLPTSLHLEWVPKAAAKGKHVLCEKPLSLTVEDLDFMLDACQKNGVQFMDGTMWMHHPRTKLMENELQDLGDIKEIRSVFSFPAEILFPSFLKENIRVQAGLDALGALGDLGWYCIRGILFAANFEMPKLVMALPNATINENGVITACSARLVWDDGKLATFTCSFHAFMTMQLIVQGTKNMLQCDDFVVPFNDKHTSYKLLSDGKFGEMDLYWEVQSRNIQVDNNIPQESLMIKEFTRIVGEIKYGNGKPEHKWVDIAKKTQAVVCAVRDSIAAAYSAISL